MIYLIEDDKSNRELVLYTLQATGYEAIGFESGETFWEAMETKLPDLVLLDMMLPGEDGLSILKKLRSSQKTNSVPVIFLTAKGSEYDKVLGLDSGADDYIAKPFGMMELVSRIRAVLRCTQQVKKVEHHHRDLVVNLVTADAEAGIAAVQQADTHGDGTDIQMLLVDHMLGSQNIFSVQHGATSDPVHGLEDIFPLNTDGQAHVIADSGHFGDKFCQRDVAGGYIRGHHHGEITLHDSLVDIQNIDIIVCQGSTDIGNDAHSVLAHDSYDCFHNILLI